MVYKSSYEYLKILDQLAKLNDLPENIIPSLMGYLKSIYRSDLAHQYSAPMLWIGMYIAGASLVCILAMVADLIHGLRSRKLWFPCKYFRINAAFLTVISVAMKLPVDLTGMMPGDVDRAAKLGSIAFLCTMMANSLPCLATMDNNEHLSNMIAMCVLVITLVVNVCIQIQTGAVSKFSYDDADGNSLRDHLLMDEVRSLGVGVTTDPDTLPTIYVIFLVVLLIVHVSSSVAILKSKKIIESKYQQRHDTASKDIQPSPGGLLTVAKLQKYVSNHWIMAGSGSPQFITACLDTTSAYGVICLIVTVLHMYTIAYIINAVFGKDYDSDYSWSMVVILIVQFIGVVIGTIAPLSRCFVTLSFKVSSKIISSHFKVFNVECYWTSKLYDWKHASIRLPFRSHNLEVVIEKLKRLIFNLCIGFQNGVVVLCKVIALFPFLFMICFLYCLKAMFSLLGKKLSEPNDDVRRYVLQIEDETELGKRTLEGLSKSVNQLIQKGEKSQPNNLMKLIREKSTSGFQGLKNFDQIDDHDIPCADCWRLQVVTLTTIAISLPRIEKEEVDSLLKCVREGLVYVTVVEKSFNATDDHVSYQKAAETLWRKIIFDKRWLGNELQDPNFLVNAAGQIVEWFRDKSKSIVSSGDRSKENIRDENDDSLRRFICANSMYRITRTILLTCLTTIDATVSQKELFNSLSSMIADIIAACLTNLPQAITLKCHTSVIEEREASVKDAAQLLGETIQIIEILQGHVIPNMDPNDMPFIDKWRAYLGNP